jgi:tripartite-type tricarboxylate transporter receptor subunit TctC
MREMGRLGLGCLALLLAASAATAQPVAEFYHGKQIHLIIADPAGGDYDLGGRLLAQHLSAHIPGAPTIVVQNMPGAASIVAANYLYNVAPKDGTTFGSVSRNLPSQAVIGRDNLKADPRRFGWIGGSSLPGRVCVARSAAPVTSAAQLFETPLIVGGAGAGSSLSIVPTVLNRVLGMKFQLVEGYKGTTDVLLAMPQGEVQGVCHTYGLFQTTQASLVKTGAIRILLHVEETPLADAPQIPSAYAYAKDERQKQLLRFAFASVEFGRPYVAPPGVPPERLAALRRAFADTLADPALVEEARRLRLDMTYRPPQALETLVANLYATPPALIAEAQEMLPTPGN